MEEKEVRKIADLAKIALRDEEILQLRDQFAAILGYIQKIDELDLGATEPASHPFNITNVFRADETASSMGVSSLLGIAPQSSKEMLRVPKIIKGSP